MSVALTYDNWNQEKLAFILRERSDYLDILKWAFQEYQDDEIVYSCSFGAEGMVLLDLIHKVKKDAKILFLDTGLHFQETYDLIDRIKQRYPSLNITIIKPKLSLSEQANQYGDALWKCNPNLCCQIRKVEPLREALKNAKAWISGLRREQSPTRKYLQYINKDPKFQNIKICPLIHWTSDDIMTYIHLNHLDYNPLHNQGYPSIGCAPCTLPAANANDSRSGRWAGHTKTECGLHQL
ncbi:phosphoadenylyl-sulfate reductase [Bacillus rubiinfantis]|uniref:phosphoadenylyl-sulfate reductase n=1 Tax=Bacillus rubiinfantis TaxID=1499680 RepID=UPI0005AA7A4B|nr:phosphoadenylyl-sulfate reductase [Bacillus rubiinfantis]